MIPYKKYKNNIRGYRIYCLADLTMYQVPSNCCSVSSETANLSFRSQPVSTSGSVRPLGIPCKELSWLFLLLLLLCAVLVSLSPVVWWWLAGPGLGCHIPSFAAHRPGDSEQPHRCRDLTVTPAQQTCCQHDTPTSLSFSVINHHQSWDQSNINLFSFICQITRSARPSQRRGINNEIITPGSVRAVCIK